MRAPTGTRRGLVIVRPLRHCAIAPLRRAPCAVRHALAVSASVRRGCGLGVATRWVRQTLQTRCCAPDARYCPKRGPDWRKPSSSALLARPSTSLRRGKPPEALDDVAVRPGEAKIAAQRLVQRNRRVAQQTLEPLDAMRLQPEVFGVHQRHVQKHAANPGQCGILIACQRVSHKRLRAGIACKRQRIAAVHVAREPIEQHDERKPRQQRARPSMQATAKRLRHERAEALRDLAVQRGIGAEPSIGHVLARPAVQQAVAEPEVEHAARLGAERGR